MSNRGFWHRAGRELQSRTRALTVAGNADVEYDTIISAVGRAAIAKQADLIRIANDLPGVVRFIPSEAGTDIAYDETSAQERPHQQKLRIRALLESEEISNITYTFLVTGPFADLYVGVMADEPQLGSFDIAARRATLLGDGEGRISLTTMTDVGKALVAVLRNPQYCDGKAVKVNSFTTTPHAILAEFERQTQSKWHVDYTPLAELQRREAEAWAAGKPLAGLYTLRRIWTQGATLYAETDNRAIGLTDTENLETVVRAAVAKPSAGYQSTAL